MTLQSDALVDSYYKKKNCIKRPSIYLDIFYLLLIIVGPQLYWPSITMILSAAIIDRDGLIYVARQYCEMSRSKVEALYMAFPRLITKGKQHTIVETNDVRYIYQAINDFYCILITDKHSNILEDIRTLRLFVGAINEYASIGKGMINEESITYNRFDLLFVFDEIVALGVRQIDNLTQLRTIMDMKSEEEKAFMESITRKEKEAKAKSAEKAKFLDQQRRNEALLQQSGGSSFVGRGLGVTSSISSESKPLEPIVETDSEPSKPIRPLSKGKAMKLRVSSKK